MDGAKVEFRVGRKWGPCFVPGVPFEVWESMRPKTVTPVITTHEYTDNVRVSRDANGQVMQCVAVEPVSKKDYTLTPQYCARLCVSRETPVALPEGVPQYYRRTKRWTRLTFGAQYDFTIVWTSPNVLFEDKPSYEVTIQGTEMIDALFTLFT